jgi:hypothetical protein
LRIKNFCSRFTRISNQPRVEALQRQQQTQLQQHSHPQHEDLMVLLHHNCFQRLITATIHTTNKQRSDTHEVINNLRLVQQLGMERIW